LGNLLIIKKWKSGFIAWLIGNVIWVYYDWKISLYSQIIMMVVYAIFNIWGWIEWNMKEKHKQN